MHDSASVSPKTTEDDSTVQVPGLRKVAPYWHAFATMAKQRWIGREILELVSSEFRDRSIEYYRYAIESGVCSVNGKPAKIGTVIKNGDRIENIVHRHEPPVTSIPVKLLLVDTEREIIVIDKPGSIPVHAAGRFNKHSLINILQNEFGFEKVYPANRLDRLTSGLMIMALSPARARQMCEEFFAGGVKKEYIARCRGEFPETEVICEEPMLTVDRQMGLNIVHPDGKPAKTSFTRLFYDPGTDTSVLHCRPFTGRSHQIRVHLQYLGHPIANDPVYCNQTAWGTKMGKGGIDLTPSSERRPPTPPPHLRPEEIVASETASPDVTPPLYTNNTYVGKTNIMPPNAAHAEAISALNSGPTRALLPRETGADVGLASPVPLSAEAVTIIMALRNMKDEDEDWGRWRDNIFKGKMPLVPPMDVRSDPLVDAATMAMHEGTAIEERHQAWEPMQEEDKGNTDRKLYCPECYLPLHPDPSPGKLFIFLHALRYTTSLGCFETEMPWWAQENWHGEGWEKY